MRPKFQKRSALKFDGLIIPEAEAERDNCVSNARPLGAVPLDTALAAGWFIRFAAGNDIHQHFADFNLCLEKKLL